MYGRLAHPRHAHAIATPMADAMPCRHFADADFLFRSSIGFLEAPDSILRADNMTYATRSSAGDTDIQAQRDGCARRHRHYH